MWFIFRFDKKKKSVSYKKAVAEAKYDAVLTMQYLESAREEDEQSEQQTPPKSQANALPNDAETWNISRKTDGADNICNAAAPNGAVMLTNSCTEEDNSAPDNKPTSSWSQKTDNIRVQSPSVLIDAFLRSDQSSDINSKIDDEMSKIDMPANDDSVNIPDCLTVALPSPQSWLQTP